MPDRREHAFNGFVVRKWSSDQRKVEERQQRFAILDQAFDGLVVFRRVFLGECRNRRLRRRPIRASQISRRSLCALAERISETCRERSTSCAASSVGDASKEGLVESFPEAERAIADGDLWRDRQPRAFKSTSNSFQLCALSRMPVWKRSTLLALGRRANQYQHAFACGSIRACR